MKAWLLAVLVLTTALAGCSGGDSPGSGTTTTTSSTSSTTTATGTPPPTVPEQVDLLLDFGHVACRGLSIAAPAPLEDIQALLPGNYSATAPTAEMEAAGQGSVNVDLYRCQNFTTPFSTLPETWFGHVYTFIEDPGQGHDAELFEYMFEVLAAEDVLAQVWTIAGYQVRNGTPGIEDNDPTGPVTPTLASRQVAVAGYDLMGAGLAPTAGSYGPASFARYTLTEAGDTLVWTGEQTLPAVHEGAGSVLVPDDSALAPLATNGRLAGLSLATDEAGFSGQDLVLYFGDA